MPIHIQRMTNEVTAFEGDLPLSQQQIEMLTKIILAELEKIERETELAREATTIRPQAAPDN